MIATSASDHRLGCYEQGLVRFIRKGRVYFKTDKFNCNWTRRNDEISQATFVITSSEDCCPRDVHAVSDFVEFERNGIIEWCGYVMRPLSTDGLLTIEAQDLLWGYTRRIIRDPSNFVQVDLANIAAAYLTSADDDDPIPVVPLLTPTGILADRIVTTSEYRICWDALGDLLNIGLDMTMVGTLLYIGPVEERGMRVIKLNERMIVGIPAAGEDGSVYAGRIIVKGQNGLTSIYPAGPATALHPYPLVESVVDASDVGDQATLDLLAKQHFDLRSETPRFISLPEGVALKEDSPYPLRALIPGRLVDVEMSTECVRFREGHRLAGVDYNLNGGKEEVKISTVPMGSVPEGMVA